MPLTLDRTGADAATPTFGPERMDAAYYLATVVELIADEMNKSDWLWVTRERPWYHNWLATEPASATGAEDCAAISGEGWWEAWQSTETLPFVCEIEQ